MISFKSNQEEVNYWKREAENYKAKYQDLQEEYEEFRQGSTELEKELESHVQILEKANQDLKINNSKLFSEVQNYKRKLESSTGHHKQEITLLTHELSQAVGAKDSLRNYIRELEQSNDDLERAKREAVVSLEDFEQRLNMAIERNAFLESELDDKDTLSETVQRLKDKAKDLKDELSIKERLIHSNEGLAFSTASASSSNRHLNTETMEDHDYPSYPNNNDASHQIRMDITNQPHKLLTKPGKALPPINSKSGHPTTDHHNSFSMDVEENSTAPSPQLSSNLPAPHHHHSLYTTDSPLTPSSRINALNVVSDLIKKVGALENKLASCRTISGFMRLNGSHTTRALASKEKNFETSPTTPNSILEPHPITS